MEELYKYNISGLGEVTANDPSGRIEWSCERDGKVARFWTNGAGEGLWWKVRVNGQNELQQQRGTTQFKIKSEADAKAKLRREWMREYGE